MIKGCLYRILIALAFVIVIPAARAAQGPSWGPEFGVEEGLTFGGGNLLNPAVTGQPALTPTNVGLYAGNTVFLQGYYRQAIGRSGLSFKTAAGGTFVCQIPTCLDVLVDVVGNTNIGNYYFGNAAGDLALEYAWDGGRVGLGRTFRVFNQLSSVDDAYAFKNVFLRLAQGWFIEYEVDRLGLRYTHLIYRSSTSGYALNGSNVGLYAHFNYHDEDWYPGGKYFNQGMGTARQALAVLLSPNEWRL